MKSGKVFYSSLDVVKHRHSDEPIHFAVGLPDDLIRHEVAFFNCHLEYAHDNGGPITRAFIDALPPEYQDGVFDSRVHMMMNGWYAGIPGWHHDDVPRPPQPVGEHFLNSAAQPDYDSPSYHAKHIMGLVNASVAPTEFVIGRCDMSQVPDGQLIYRQWHNEIEEQLAAGKIKKAPCPDRTLVSFTADDFHTAVPAVKHGWRWFGRVSIDTDRQKSRTNEIRVNAQIYLPFPTEGW